MTILKPLYEQLSRQAILTVKAEHVATFLGHKITPQLAQQIGSQFATRIEGTCVKHRFGKSSIKIYDKFALVLRIETTTNDVSAFKHYVGPRPPSCLVRRCPRCRGLHDADGRGTCRNGLHRPALQPAGRWSCERSRRDPPSSLPDGLGRDGSAGIHCLSRPGFSEPRGIQ